MVATPTAVQTPQPGRRKALTARTARQAMTAATIASVSVASPSDATHAAMLAFLPDTLRATVEALPVEDQRAVTQAVTQAQAAYFSRLSAMDARLRAYSRQVTPDEVIEALCVLRGFFRLRAGEDLSLRAVILWASHVATSAADALAARQPPPLPLPYRHLSPRQLAELAATESEAFHANTDHLHQTTRQARRQARRQERPADSQARQDCQIIRRQPGGRAGTAEPARRRSSGDSADRATQSVAQHPRQERRDPNRRPRAHANTHASEGAQAGEAPIAAGVGQRRPRGRQPRAGGHGQATA